MLFQLFLIRMFVCDIVCLCLCVYLFVQCKYLQLVDCFFLLIYLLCMFVHTQNYLVRINKFIDTFAHVHDAHYLDEWLFTKTDSVLQKKQEKEKYKL